MNNQLQDIISDIKKENCVLIIGPDMIDMGDKSFFETMCEDFLKDSQYKNIIDAAPQYIFLNEELLQLLPSAKETTVLRMMERFYQKQTGFDGPLNKISQIPFHLIISLLPDERLQKIFKEQNLDFNYSHYPREEPPVQVEKPTQKKPLIYNLLGDFNEGDVIITFDHLIAFLSGIMGKRELPQNIQEALKKARTFVFLGVHFEKWYVQLMLRIITSKDKKEKYTILKNGNNNDVCTFIARRLELDFIAADPLTFLDQIYDECKEQNLLKTVVNQKKAKVFISYSHRDKHLLKDIQKVLNLDDIDVVFDDNAMTGGQKIEDFIKTIKDVDIVIPLISENSLLSPWVSKEIITTLTKTNKNFLPCYLDEAFLDKGFIEKAEKIVDEKIKTIDERLQVRGKANSDDLFTERKGWTDYYTNLPMILNELTKRKCISLTSSDFENNIHIVVDDINKLMKQK